MRGPKAFVVAQEVNPAGLVSSNSGNLDKNRDKMLATKSIGGAQCALLNNKMNTERFMSQGIRSVFSFYWLM